MTAVPRSRRQVYKMRPLIKRRGDKGSVLRDGREFWGTIIVNPKFWQSFFHIGRNAQSS